jgi:hypothetical protein
MIGGLPWKLPVAAALGVGVALAAPSGISRNAEICGKPWVFFDLGNTVIASVPGQSFHYLPGAHAYLRELKKRGFSLGLITNIPENWGPTRAERIRKLKKMIREGWSKETGTEAMDWSDFPETSIVIPRRRSERKPAPYLYHAALAKVSLAEGEKNCPVYFEGEDPGEVAQADREGMIGYLVGKNPAAPYFPIESLERR